MSETYQFSTLNGVPLFNGIKFPPTQVPSADPNTLDDYEEGTWTPSIIFGGASVGLTYVEQIGTYRKVGSLIFIRARISLSSKGTSIGNAEIAGLPFVASAGINATPLATFSTNVTSLVTVLKPSSNAVLEIAIDGIGAYTRATDTTFNSASSIRFEGHYTI